MDKYRLLDNNGSLSYIWQWLFEGLVMRVRATNLTIAGDQVNHPRMHQMDELEPRGSIKPATHSELATTAHALEKPTWIG